MKTIILVDKSTIVYWKGSKVTVYKKDSEGNEVVRRLYRIPDRQGIVEPGSKLYIKDGRVKQE